jgi:serine acetyltransferase
VHNIEPGTKSDEVRRPLAKQLAAVRSLISADVSRYARESASFQSGRPGKLRKLSILLTPSLMCVSLYRIAHALYTSGWVRTARSMTILNHRLHRIWIEPTACIGPGLYIPHPSGVLFRGTAGRDLCLFTQAIVGPLSSPIFKMNADDCPRLGDYITIGVGAVLLGPITVGAQCAIGPGVVVRRPLPARTRIVATYLHPKRANRTNETETAASS